MRVLVVAAALVLAPTLAFADDTAAVALHDQGIADMKAGNLEAACKELGQSLALAPDSGTKGALASCYTKQNKLASAWVLWKNLADTAPSDDMRSDARAFAAALEPRLPHFVVKFAGPAPAGLVVTVNGQVVDPSLQVLLPVDPGPVAASARAPGHVDWSQTSTAEDAKTLTIEVPVLAEQPTSGGMVGGLNGGIVSGTPGPASSAPPAQHRHVIGIVTGAAGLAVIGVGAIFGVQASSKWSDAKTACGGDIDHCTNIPGSQPDVTSARSAATISTIGFGVGGAAVIAGAIIYMTAPSNVERQALRVVPSVGPSSAGLALIGGF